MYLNSNSSPLDDIIAALEAHMLQVLPHADPESLHIISQTWEILHRERRLDSLKPKRKSGYSEAYSVNRIEPEEKKPRRGYK